MDGARQTHVSPLRSAGILLLAVLQMSCGDAAAPPVPAGLVVAAGDGQEAVVATALPAPITVRVSDRGGRPMGGVAVTWSTSSSGGTLAPASGQTDADGQASATWTLGTVAGPVTASATVAGLAPATLRATARPGPVAEVLALSGDGQRAEVGEPLPAPLRIRAEDAWGNGVAGVAVNWVADSGTLDDIEPVTGSDGSASAVWTLGREAGPTGSTARVSSGGGATVEARFSSVADPTTLNLTVAGAYVVQSVQRWEGDVPLVAGKAGLLRVFVEANRETAQRADVRVEVWDAAGVLVADEAIAPPPGFAPGPGVSETPANASYNWNVSDDWMAPGVRIAVTVDPDDGVVETDEGDNGLPGGGGLTPVVETVAPFRVTFVPVRINGQVGTIESPELMLWNLARMFPLNEIEGQVRPDTLDFGAYTLLEVSDFPQIVNAVLAARLAEGAEPTWFGLLPYVDGAPFGGWAAVGGPAAIGLAGESMLAAHELGHTFGRRHPPCGTAGGPDPDFPYAEAATGVYGFDLLNSSVQPADRTDIMSYSYCGEAHWISDYTYEGVMEFRAAVAAASVTAPPAPAQPSLIVWGRVEGDSLVLEPAFRAVVPPSLPDEAGPYRLEGVDESGARVFDLSFQPTPVADAPEGTAVFAFAVPLDETRLVATLRLGDGFRTAERRSPANGSREAVSLERVDGDRVRLRWNAARLPLVVVRDRDTGRVLSFARGGDAVVSARSGRSLALVASTGADGRAVEPIRR